MYNKEINHLKQVNKKYLLIDIILIIIDLIILNLSLIFVNYHNVIIYAVINCFITLIISWFIIYSLKEYILKNKAYLTHYLNVSNKGQLNIQIKIIDIKQPITISKYLMAYVVEAETNGIIRNYYSLDKPMFNIDDELLIKVIDNFIISYDEVK